MANNRSAEADSPALPDFQVSRPTTYHPPSDAQKKALVELIRKLSATYSLSREEITLHRNVDGSSTECPGLLLTLDDVLYLLDN